MTSPHSDARPPVSVVISNYNYARYLGVAIDSALAQDWPEVEVIVVDDGSTDTSAQIMASYGRRIRPFFQTNGGQRAACNTGFAQASHDVVVFLDADDVLDRNFLQATVPLLTQGVSKVQCQMRIIDADGRANGNVLPHFHGTPSPAQIRTWATAVSHYPSPPGSANVYARWYLETIFPLLGEEYASDSYCIAAAPFVGDVVTVPIPLVSYRIHGANDGAMTDLGDDARFSKEVARGLFRHNYAAGIAKARGLHIEPNGVLCGFHFNAYRVASLRLAPKTHAIAGDSIARLTRDLVRGLHRPQGLSTGANLAFTTWTMAVAFAPKPLARHLVRWRFVPSSRPAGARKMLNTLRIIDEAPLADTDEPQPAQASPSALRDNQQFGALY